MVLHNSCMNFALQMKGVEKKDAFEILPFSFDVCLFRVLRTSSLCRIVPRGRAAQLRACYSPSVERHDCITAPHAGAQSQATTRSPEVDDPDNPPAFRSMGPLLEELEGRSKLRRPKPRPCGPSSLKRNVRGTPRQVAHVTKSFDSPLLHM